MEKVEEVWPPLKLKNNGGPTSWTFLNFLCFQRYELFVIFGAQNSLPKYWFSRKILLHGSFYILKLSYDQENTYLWDFATTPNALHYWPLLCVVVWLWYKISVACSSANNIHNKLNKTKYKICFIFSSLLYWNWNIKKINNKSRINLL